MTYEEALDVLVNKIQIDVNFTEDFNRDYDCLTKCKEALKKQIPQKPKLINSNFFGEKTPTCPICGDNWNSNEFGSGMECCWTCGQAIDWSELK